TASERKDKDKEVPPVAAKSRAEKVPPRAKTPAPASPAPCAPLPVAAPPPVPALPVPGKLTSKSRSHPPLDEPRASEEQYEPGCGFSEPNASDFANAFKAHAPEHLRELQNQLSA